MCMATWPLWSSSSMLSRNAFSIFRDRSNPLQQSAVSSSSLLCTLSNYKFQSQLHESVAMMPSAMLSRMVLQHTARLQVQYQPQFVAAFSLPIVDNFRRFFAEDALDSSEKAMLKGRDEATKAKETWNETKDAVKETVDESEQKSESVVNSTKEHAKKEMNTARDMVKDIPQKSKETAQELKEVGVEAAKAVKRDTERMAEKVGIKDKKPGNLDILENE